MAKQKIKQFWFVCKLAVTADPNKETINFGQAQAEVARPAPRIRNRNEIPVPQGHVEGDMLAAEKFCNARAVLAADAERKQQ